MKPNKEKELTKLKTALNEATKRAEEVKKIGFISLAIEGFDLLIAATKRYIEAVE